jgi:tetratricopeptide (TPR) repeat protein
MKTFSMILAAGFIFSGCGIWNNFTTYFNLYYNTSQLFEQAEITIKEQEKDLFAMEEINIPSTANQQLVKVIEKASRILQFHSNTAFVDDALMMLGKSFYYQKNYQKGLRKFQELLASQDDSGLLLETRLWIGKSQMRLRDFDAGLATLNEVRLEAIEEDEDEIFNQAFIEEIKYRIFREDYPGAIELSKEFLQISGDDVLRAETSYQLGNLFLYEDDLENALVAFENTIEYSPIYKTELNSKISAGKVLRDLGMRDEALSAFRSLRNEDKYIDDFSEIDLEIGISLLEIGEPENAYNQLKYVDTTYTATTHAGVARFKLGQLFEYDYQNFDSAAVYYQKAATTTAPAEFTLAAVEKSQRFRKYANLQSQISDNRKKLIYVLNPEEFVKDSIAFYEDSLETAENNLRLSDDAGQEQLQQGRGRDRELTAPTQTQTPQQQLNKQPPVRPALTADSLASLIVKSTFELGNLFYSEFEIPDSAYFYYMQIHDDFPNSDYHARTLYSLGSYFESEGETEKADSLYEIVYDQYKDEDIVNAAAVKLDRPLINLDFDPAKENYAKAEQSLMREEYASSLKEFYNIYKDYPSSNYAPKALYASAWILENELSLLDSAASVYDSLLAAYPQSQYSSTVRPKVQLYKQEKERIRKAAADSLQAIQLERQKADSLKQMDTQITQPNLEENIAPVDTAGTFDPSQFPVPGEVDSLEQQHQLLLDSLERTRPQTDDELEERLDRKIDSLDVRRD